MKEFLLLLFCISLRLVSSCLQYNDIADNDLEEKVILDSGKYDRIYKMNITQIKYEIYDTTGTGVRSAEKENKSLYLKIPLDLM